MSRAGVDGAPARALNGRGHVPLRRGERRAEADHLKPRDRDADDEPENHQYDEQLDGGEAPIVVSSIH